MMPPPRSRSRRVTKLFTRRPRCSSPCRRRSSSSTRPPDLRVDGPPAPLPRVGAAVRGHRADRATRGRGASTATRPSSCWATWCSERAGMPFADYLREGVLAPLGMTATTATGSPAHGGRVERGRPAALRRRAAAPGPRARAGAARRGDHARSCPTLAGVLPGYGRQAPNPWGLGLRAPRPQGAALDARRGRRRETFGHFGQSGAFLWVDPTAGVACARAVQRALRTLGPARLAGPGDDAATAAAR